MIAGVIIGGSFLALVQIAVVVMGWRFAKLRGDALVVVEAATEESEPGNVWAGLDRADRHVWDSHCDDAVLLTHEADPDLSEDNEAYADDFLAWTAEIRERAQ